MIAGQDIISKVLERVVCGYCQSVRVIGFDTNFAVWSKWIDGEVFKGISDWKIKFSGFGQTTVFYFKMACCCCCC